VTITVRLLAEHWVLVLAAVAILIELRRLWVDG
jgi:hypothetical protein